LVQAFLKKWWVESDLAKTLNECDFSKLKPFPPGEPQKFASFLDKVMGFS
jgi:hypothetical protein